MPEYKLKFSEEDDESRQRTLNEIHAFISVMNNRPLAVTTLDKEQSNNWDQEGEIDYQDAYGRQIVGQITDSVTETLIICNSGGLPVALAALDRNKSWQGIGIDKRLRNEIAIILQIEKFDFDDMDSDNNTPAPH